MQLLKFLCTFGSKLSMKFPKVFPVVLKLSILVAKLSKLYWLLIKLIVVEVRCDVIVFPKLRLQLLKLLCTFSCRSFCLIFLRFSKYSASSRKVFEAPCVWIYKLPKLNLPAEACRPERPTFRQAHLEDGPL